MTKVEEGGSSSPTDKKRKRTRPVSACEPCRLQKVKCIIKPGLEEPICERCASQSKDCVFRLDDLAPAFRAAHFSHLGPPGEGAREIKSKSKDTRSSAVVGRSGSSPTKPAASSTKTTDRRQKRRKSSSGAATTSKAEDSDDSEQDEVDSAPEQSPKAPPVEPPRRPVKRYEDRSSADTTFGSVASASAIPAHTNRSHGYLATPPPFASRAISGSAPSNSLYQPAPIPYAYAHQQPPPELSYPPPGMAAIPRSPYARFGPDPGLPPPGHHYSEHPHAPPMHHQPHLQPSGYPGQPLFQPHHYASSSYYPTSVTHPSPGAPGPSRTAPPPPAFSAPSPPAYSRGGYPGHSSNRSINAKPPGAAAITVDGRALPPIEVALAGLRGKGSRPATGQGHATSPRNASTSSSSVAPRYGDSQTDSFPAPRLSPLVSFRSPPTLGRPNASPQSFNRRGATMDRKPSLDGRRPSGASPSENSPSAGSKGSSTKKTSLVVPFFRWFGLTANTPGYRRIKVAVNPDLPEDEDEHDELDGTPDGTPAEARADAAEDDPPRLAGSPLAKDTSHKPTNTTGEEEAATSTATAPDLSTPAVMSSPAEIGTPASGLAASKTSEQVLRRSSLANERRATHQFASLDSESMASASTRDLFDPSRPRYPRQDILTHLAELFIKLFRPNLCPWVETEALLKGARDSTLPAILANSICAMTARFSDWPELKLKPAKTAGEPFSEMAKTLIVPVLSWPSLDVIEALVLLSYAEFGAGSDSGLWMYSGMAMRMAMDLGIQHETTIQSLPTQAEQTKARWLFWSGCYAIDRITCFGTGRPVTMLESAIDCSPPTVASGEDCFYASLIIQILLRRGRMGELLNSKPDAMKLYEKKTKLMEMWQECASYFQSLPSSCAFGVQSFKRAACSGEGAAFLYLHVLFQSTVSLLERPGLVRSREMEAAGNFGGLSHISASTSRSIVDMISLALQVDPKSFESSPYLDQLILPTGRAFIGERESIRETLRQFGYVAEPSRQASPTPKTSSQQQASDSTNAGGSGATTTGGPTSSSASDSRLASLLSARKTVSDNLQNCITWLGTLAHYWGGASWPARALEQEAAGAGTEYVEPDVRDDDAMQAPLRDMELLSAWAKERLKQAREKERLAASRRGSLSAERRSLTTEGTNTTASGSSGKSVTPGVTLESLLAAAGADSAQYTSAVATAPPPQQDEEEEDNALGLALSGQLATSAELDLSALMDYWIQESASSQQTLANRSLLATNGNGTQVTTGRTNGPWSQQQQGQEQQVSNHQGSSYPTLSQQYPFNSNHNHHLGTTAQSFGGGAPMMDFSALQLEELLATDLGGFDQNNSQNTVSTNHQYQQQQQQQGHPSGQPTGDGHNNMNTEQQTGGGGGGPMYSGPLELGGLEDMPGMAFQNISSALFGYH